MRIKYFCNSTGRSYQLVLYKQSLISMKLSVASYPNWQYRNSVEVPVTKAINSIQIVKSACLKYWKWNKSFVWMQFWKLSTRLFWQYFYKNINSSKHEVIITKSNWKTLQAKNPVNKISSIRMNGLYVSVDCKNQLGIWRKNGFIWWMVLLGTNWSKLLTS